MNKRVWIGILTGVVAVVVVLGVAGAAFKGGDDDHDEVTRTVPVGGTGEVQVVGGDEEHKNGFFLLPLLLIPLVILGVAAALGGFGNGGPHGRDASFEEQHRRAHEHANAVRPGPAPHPASEAEAEAEAKM